MSPQPSPLRQPRVRVVLNMAPGSALFYLYIKKKRYRVCRVWLRDSRGVSSLAAGQPGCVEFGCGNSPEGFVWFDNQTQKGAFCVTARKGAFG
ncbi:hypothetical protein Tco_0683119 [Tanacetum coccineum]|uniref:Uncharacterized protein n=1 Tax=Tanacetum coccineum TaxID=301880 RepID=A0ABQ4XT30_9ASTR